MIRGSSTWSTERIETLTTMWRAGRSGNEIARHIGGGITRNAVIGKAHRLGLAGHQSKDAREARKSQSMQVRHRAVKRSKEKPMTKDTVMSRIFGDACPLPQEDTPKGPLVMFADLEAHHCRAPYGDPKQDGFGFCGCKVVPGISYCADHARRFLTLSQPRPPHTRAVNPSVDSEFTTTVRAREFVG